MQRTSLAQETERSRHRSEEAARSGQRRNLGQIASRRLDLRTRNVSLTPHDLPIVGIFQWMPNSGNEAKRMEKEIVKYTGIIKRVFMDSKADDQKLYFGLKKNYKMRLVTSPRKGMDKSASRKKMIKEMLTKRNMKDYKERSVTVEPMQGLVANIFELERCWMRGNLNNRWIFAAMGIAVQMAQFDAYKKHRSTWEIKNQVLGV